MTTKTADKPGALAKRPDPKPIDEVRHALKLLEPQLALALPKHLTPERLCRVAITQIQQTPKLLECSRQSLYAAIVTAAQLGLEPDGVLGHAYLVPFAGKVQLIVGYKGLIALARNSGDVSSIQAQPVFSNDKFDFEYGTNEHLAHVPASGDDRGDLVGFYAYARFNDGGFHFEVMTRSEVEAVRNGSKGYQTALRYAKPNQEPDTPWVTHYLEMGRKTAIRRLAKYLPLSVQKAVAINAAYEDNRPASLGEAGELLLPPPEDVTDVQVVPEGEAPSAGASRMDEIADQAAAQG